MTISSDALRKSFLDFFRRHQHVIEPSAPLIPKDDKTLLFVNAGMVQFKNVFTQKEVRPYKRAASSQKCVRAGGKHNDLENVGHTARHHTFFEMLGNFSFGDYFKEQAITYAWQFLTEELGLDRSRLSVSIFAGDDHVPADHEAEKIWHELIGISKDKIKHLPRKDNFWQMGDTGPCGPCTEIHYDRGDIHIGFGGDNADDRNIEIWNLVFMQYDMQKDGSLRPLPAPCVDTGMGLERLSCIINELPSNYDTDLLRPLITKTEELCQRKYLGSDSSDDVAMRVIADHARASAFLIADGLFPGNEGRGYILRRFMRRAIRHGAHIGLVEPFFHNVCLEVISVMGGYYQELEQARSIIEKVTKQEEGAFRKTLDRGLILFAKETDKLHPTDKLNGDTVFRLYETFGFPPDLTEDLAKEKGLVIDWQEYEQAKMDHESRSSHGLGLKGIDDIYLELAERIGKTNFVDAPQVANMKTVALIKDGQPIDSLKKGEQGIAIFDNSPFYGESGGQVGDTGKLFSNEVQADVSDTKKITGLTLHLIEVKEGQIQIDDLMTGLVDWTRRECIRRNHSATHLLHSALRQILGDHVVQKGSLVAPDRLRFDFAHFEALSREQLEEVEDLTNRWILDNEEAKAQEMSMDDAKAYGALALFGEKYQKKVRVLDMGSHSRELCGGTHCHRTGDIGSFRIISEGPLAQGIRRIEAITGIKAIEHGQQSDRLLKEMAQKLSANQDELLSRVDLLQKQLRELERALETKTSESLKEEASKAASRADAIGDIRFVMQVVDFIKDPAHMRTYADLVRDRIHRGVVALGCTLEGNKCLLLVAATRDLAKQIHAGKLVSKAAPIIDGKGGGRPDFAQAGGSNSVGLGDALNAVKTQLEEQLGQS